MCLIFILLFMISSLQNDVCCSYAEKRDYDEALKFFDVVSNILNGLSSEELSLRLSQLHVAFDLDRPVDERIATLTEIILEEHPGFDRRRASQVAEAMVCDLWILEDIIPFIGGRGNMRMFTKTVINKEFLLGSSQHRYDKLVEFVGKALGKRGKGQDFNC